MLQPRWLFLFLFFILINSKVNTLSIVRAILPSNVNYGSPLWLNCTHDLPREKLYSIKWYKDSQEFYQYIPSNKPPKRQYPLEGIYLDLKKSYFGNVYLKRTDHNSAGNYKCEISSEAPLFKTLRDIKQLRVKYNSSFSINQVSCWSLSLFTAIFQLTFCNFRPSFF